MDGILLFAAGMVTGIVIAVIVLRRTNGDMIEQQRRDAAGSTRTTYARPAAHAPPTSEPLETLDLSDDPELREAFVKGHKINAIKILRERTGLGLREAKDIVESQWPH